VLQRTAISRLTKWRGNTQQRAATHCITVQYAAMHGNSLPDRASRQYTAKYCNTLQHAATHVNRESERKGKRESETVRERESERE